MQVMGQNVLLVDFRKIQGALSLEASRKLGCDVVACELYDLIFDDRRDNAAKARCGEFIDHRLTPFRLMKICFEIDFSHMY